MNVPKSCMKCRRPCDGEAFVALKDGTTFHRSCFTCDICQGELPLKFALKNGKYYHTECYANAKATSPKCLKCDTPIIPAEISVVLGNDMRFHSRCFICDTCNRPLSDRFYSNNGKFFHEECISCSLCGIPLMGQNFSQLQDGGYICDTCLYKSMRGSNPSSGPSTEKINQVQQSAGYRPAQPAQNVPYFNPEGGYEESWAQQGNDWNNYPPQQNQWNGGGGYGGPGYQNGGYYSPINNSKPPAPGGYQDMQYNNWNQGNQGYCPGPNYNGPYPPQRVGSAGPPPNMQPRPMGSYPPRR